jgi:hypothetical protein
MRYTLAAIALLAACPLPAAAQTQTATLNASIMEMARLSLSNGSLSFPDADPDTVPQIAASTGPVTITAKARATPGGAVTLTVRASDDLRSGLDTIPASSITWTATGAGFAGGTLSRTTDTLLGEWIGSGVHVGSASFRFQNLWTYPTGTYTLTMTFTLSAA